MADRHPPATGGEAEEAAMAQAATVDQMSRSPPASAARSRHLRATLLQSEGAAAAASASSTPDSTGAPALGAVPPPAACYFIAPSGESIVSNKPFALELRLWLHTRRQTEQSARAAAAASPASTSASASASVASTATASSAPGWDRTLLLFPLAVKISARSVEKKTNVYHSLQRVWVRAQLQQQQQEGRDEDEQTESDGGSPAQTNKKQAAIHKPAAHPRAAHSSAKATQSDDEEDAASDSDEDGHGEEAEDGIAVHSSDHSAQVDSAAAAAAAAVSAMDSSTASHPALPFLPPAAASATSKAKKARATKGPLFKPLYRIGGRKAISKSDREEQRDRSIGTAHIQTRRPAAAAAVSAQAEWSDIAHLIPHLHVSYAPLQRGDDAGLLTHVLTKGGASDKRPKQKYILFQAGFTYSIELPALPSSSFAWTLHSLRLRSWEQQLAPLTVLADETALPPFPSPNSKRSRPTAAASAKPTTKPKAKVKPDQDSDGDDGSVEEEENGGPNDDVLDSDEQKNAELAHAHRTPSIRAAAQRVAAMAMSSASAFQPTAAEAVKMRQSARTFVSAAANSSKPDQTQSALGRLPVAIRPSRSLSPLLAAIEQVDQQQSDARQMTATESASAWHRYPLRSSSQVAGRTARTVSSAEDSDGGSSSATATTASQASRRSTRPTSIRSESSAELDEGSGWGTDTVQPTAKRIKGDPSHIQMHAAAAAVASTSAASAFRAQPSSAVAAAPLRKKSFRRPLFTTKHQRSKHAVQIGRAAQHDGRTPSKPAKQLDEAAAAVAVGTSASGHPTTPVSSAPFVPITPWHLQNTPNQPFTASARGIEAMAQPLRHSGSISGSSNNNHGAYSISSQPCAYHHAPSILSGAGLMSFSHPPACSSTQAAINQPQAFSLHAASPAPWVATAATSGPNAILRLPSTPAATPTMPLTPASPFHGGDCGMSDSSSPSSSPAVPMQLSGSGSPMSPLQLIPPAASAPHSGSTSSGRCTPLPTSISTAVAAAGSSPRSSFALGGLYHSPRQPHARRTLHLPLSSSNSSTNNSGAGSVGLGSGAGLGFHAVHSPTQGRGRLGFQPRSLHQSLQMMAGAASNGGMSASGMSLLSPQASLSALLLGGAGRSLYSPAPHSTDATAGSQPSDVASIAEHLAGRGAMSGAVAMGQTQATSEGDLIVAGETDVAVSQPPSPSHSSTSTSAPRAPTPTAAPILSPPHLFLRANLTNGSHLGR